MKESTLAKRYATAFVNTIDASQRAGVIKESVIAIQSISNTASVFEWIKNPLVPQDKKEGAIKTLQSSGKLSEEVGTLILLLLKKKRSSIMPHLAKELISIYDNLSGQKNASIRSAKALSEAQKSQILAYLSSQISDANIAAKYSVDSSLIGGFQIEVDDKLYDASIKNTLEKLNEKISN